MFLPLFPLDLAVFPGEQLKLHIFEPRYRQLIRECAAEDKTFGIPAYIDGRVAEFGTEVAIVDIVRQYETGEMDIVTEGRRVFHLEKFIKTVPEKLYSGGEVHFIRNNPDTSSFDLQHLKEAYLRFHELLQSGKDEVELNQENISFVLGHEVGLTTTQKVLLLATPNEGDRLRMIEEHLKKTIPVLEAADETRKHIRRNGRFKRLPELNL